MWPILGPDFRPSECPIPLADDAARVLSAAIAIARRDGEPCLSTVHFLLGLIAAGGTRAADVLARSGITAASVRKLSSDFQLPGIGDRPHAPEVVTPMAERCLEVAWAEARGRGDPAADSYDLLTAIAREDGGIAGDLLVRLVPE